MESVGKRKRTQVMEDNVKAKKAKPTANQKKKTAKGKSPSKKASTSNNKTKAVKMSWGYDKDNGPDTWAKSFPDAGGATQSPVDIRPETAIFDKSLANNPINVNYSTETDLELENPGLSFKINIHGDSYISGGPLGDTKYKLEQFHFHWGHDDKTGSEHTINGKMYPSELHLVHYNTAKYKSFGEAVSQRDGLAVLGVFITVGQQDHKGFKILADNAVKVKCKAVKAKTGASFNPNTLLPNDLSKFWTYEGSLTTPPCYESVTWIVLKEGISVSEAQIKALRCLCCDDCGSKPIPANYRPPLPLGSREIKSSFQ